MLGTTIEGMMNKHRAEEDELMLQVAELETKSMFEGVKVMKTITVKIRKKHECAKCSKSIPKGSKAINTVIRYDNRLVSVYFCSECKKLNA